jgi:hypothetical protein
MPDATQEILEEVRALRDEVRELHRQVGRDELPRLQDLADEIGVARSTLYSKLDRKGIPVRDSHGFPKSDGDRSAAHVSRTEWEAAEELDTRTVRQRAGLYD